MEGESKGQQGKTPSKKGNDVDQLLEELKTLHDSLAKHQKPMAILFADLKGSTAIFGERSDFDGILFLQRSESLIRTLVDHHAGTVIKTVGDAIMASFPSANDAVHAAIAIQRAVEEHNSDKTLEDQFSLRIGINAGKGVIKDKDIFGQVVNIAAKVQGVAEGGQILVSKATFQELERELAQRAEEFDALEVPGLTQPIEVYQVLWQEECQPMHPRPVRRGVLRAEEEQKLLVLDLSLDADRIKAGAVERYPGEEQTLKSYQEIVYPADTIEKLQKAIINVLNRANLKGLLDRALLKELERLGQLLFDSLFPMQVKEKLHRTSVNDLIIHIDDKLVQIPWELMFDGQEFLSNRFNMGRVVRTRQTLSDVSVRQVQRPLKMLIMANPKGDLEASYREAVALRDALEEVGEDIIVDFVSNEIRAEYARKHLRDYDIVHFAGHAKYHLDAPEKSAWLFHDGEFTSSDIIKMAGKKPLPALVFSNACQSGYTEEWKVSEHLGQEIYGLANAFLLSGVQHYIGTFWEIPDDSSAQFALAFYSKLIKGLSVGEALRQARRASIAQIGADSVIWSSYMLYGDPTICLFPSEQESRVGEHLEPPEDTPRGPSEKNDKEPNGQTDKAPRWSVGYGLAAAIVAGLLFTGGYYLLSSLSTEQKPGHPEPMLESPAQTFHKPATPPLETPRPGQATVTPPMAAAPTVVQLELTMGVIGQRVGDPAQIVIREGDALKSGDRFRVKYQTNDDAYVYILMLGSQGKTTQLFPDPKIQVRNRAVGGQEYKIPTGSLWFGLDEVPGIETIYVIASREPIQRMPELVASLNDISSEYLARQSSQGPMVAQAPLSIRGTSGLVQGENQPTKPVDNKLIRKMTESIQKEVLVVKAMSFLHK